MVLVVVVWSPLLGGGEEGGHQLGGVSVPRQGLAGSSYGEGQQGAAWRGTRKVIKPLVANRCVFSCLKPILGFIDHLIHLNESESTKVLKVPNEQTVFR